MTNQIARRWLFVLVLLLLIGTLMPGAWRAGIESSLQLPWGVSSSAHLVLFAAMGWVAVIPLAWPWPRVALAALALALLTEGLQFFAIERQPRWQDVGIDMAGVGIGLVVGWVGWVLGKRRERSDS